MRKLLWNAEEIRFDLYELRNQLVGEKNDHLLASMRAGGHKPECVNCACCDARIAGIDRAIRHFGGRPRR